MSTNDWHQQQCAAIVAARAHIAEDEKGLMADFFARLRLSRERLAASDAAMAAGDYPTAIKLLQEELNNDGFDL